MTRTHRINAAAIAITVVITAGLAGCMTPGSTGPSPDAARPAVDVALEKFNSSNAASNEAELAGSYEWRDGYSVLLYVTGENNDGPYDYYQAYGVVPDGDAWMIANYNTVDSASDPTRFPERATCLTLSEDQEEYALCSAIEG